MCTVGGQPGFRPGYNDDIVIPERKTIPTRGVEQDRFQLASLLRPLHTAHIHGVPTPMRYTLALSAPRHSAGRGRHDVASSAVATRKRKPAPPGGWICLQLPELRFIDLDAEARRLPEDDEAVLDAVV